jgi:hypothetical protein
LWYILPFWYVAPRKNCQPWLQQDRRKKIVEKYIGCIMFCNFLQSWQRNLQIFILCGNCLPMGSCRKITEEAGNILGLF